MSRREQAEDIVACLVVALVGWSALEAVAHAALWGWL